MNGFFRSPVGFKQDLYLISQQSLWIWNGRLSRLGSFGGEIRELCISPDGKLLSFIGSEASNGDVYLFNLADGSLVRKTYFDDAKITNISLDTDGTVLVSSSKDSPFRENAIFEVGQTTNKLKYRDTHWISRNGSKILLQRFGYGYQMWLGYRGGLVGRIFYGTDDKLEELKLFDSNCIRPFFVDNRILFASDVDGRMNIYEYITSSGKPIQRTFHKDFGVRDYSFSDNNIFYSCGGDIYRYDLSTNTNTKLEIYGPDYSYDSGDFSGISNGNYITSVAVDDTGSGLVFAARGHVFSCQPWKKGYSQHTTQVRYKFVEYLTQDTLIMIKDSLGICTVQKFNLQTNEIVYSGNYELGLVLALHVMDANNLIIANSKGELILIRLLEQDIKKIVRGKSNKIHGFDTSPDTKWLSYAIDDHTNTSTIFLYNFESGEHYPITDNGGFSPSFSPDGNYLFFLSGQELNPSYDAFYFNLSFKENIAVAAACLNKKAPHPFKPWESNTPPVPDGDNTKDTDQTENLDKDKTPNIKAIKETKMTPIDISSIVILKSEIQNGNYLSIIPVSNTKLMLLVKDDIKPKNLNLALVDLNNNQINTIGHNLDLIHISQNREYMVLLSDEKFRIGKAGEQFEENDKSHKAGGFVSVPSKIIKIKQDEEWTNILEEAWWLLKEHFWCGQPTDWPQILDKYRSKLHKIRSREDLNYLMEELIGETRTSHNYILNRGDRKMLTHTPHGYLAADFEWDNGYRITHLPNLRDLHGLHPLPLLEPGNRMEIGDVLISVNGTQCTQEVTPEMLLSNQGGFTVVLTFKRDGTLHTIYPKTLNTLKHIQYRLWVNKNREYVHQKTSGRIGYLHVPDMVRNGFSEFHRGYAREKGKEGLIIDNRYNSGGHVSPLLISILRNTQHGAYLFQDQIEEFPQYSNSGLMVLLSNEYSGSDGDLFTHQFKHYQLGKVIGRRTWGGVVGISPRYSFIDAGLVSQAEFGIWEDGCGISIENYGVDPDIDVESPIDSQDDPQLDCAIENILLDLPSKSIMTRIREESSRYIKKLTDSQI